MGKLTREQFALAMHLIQQKVLKGVEPPQALTADMVPPSERGTPITVGPSASNLLSLRHVHTCALHARPPLPLLKEAP